MQNTWRIKPGTERRYCSNRTVSGSVYMGCGAAPRYSRPLVPCTGGRVHSHPTLRLHTDSETALIRITAAGEMLRQAQHGGLFVITVLTFVSVLLVVLFTKRFIKIG